MSRALQAPRLTVTRARPASAVALPALRAARHALARPRRAAPRTIRHLDGACLLVPVRAYDVSRGLCVVRRRTARSDDCISFRASLPNIAVEIIRPDADYIDLDFVAPSGEGLSVYAALQTASGQRRPGRPRTAARR